MKFQLNILRNVVLNAERLKNLTGITIYMNITALIVVCSNDDRLGAINIQLLGTQYISGQEQPKFELTTNA